MSERRIEFVSKPRVDDHLIAALLVEALSLLEEDPATARQRIKISLALTERHHQRNEKRGILAQWQLTDALNYIRENIGSRLKVREVARRAALSPNHFSQAFKATTGMSYCEFLIKARVDLAKDLLRSADMSIAEIALVCGLSDQSHLTRLFNRLVGLPPAAWRRRLVHGALDQLDNNVRRIDTQGSTPSTPSGGGSATMSREQLG